MSRPRLLLLDEPSMGLAPIMVQKIFEIIRHIAANGVTLLLVEQNAKLALEVSNRGYVMESGRIVLADSAAALLANPQVQNAIWAGRVYSSVTDSTVVRKRDPDGARSRFAGNLAVPRAGHGHPDP